MGNFLTTNLATAEWTRKWRHRGKAPKWNKTNLQTTELLNNGVNKLHKNCPIKVHRLFITLTRLLTNSMATENCEISENSVEIFILTAKTKLK